MVKVKSKLSAVTQNVIIGCVSGLIIGYNLKYIFNSIGASDLLWLMFFLIGPLVGFLSGKERQRYEKLKKVKVNLEKNIITLQNRLQQSSEKYKLLIEQINDAVFLTTSKGKFVFFNSVTSHLTGYAYSKLKTMNIGDLSYSPENIITPDQYDWENDNYRYVTIWKRKNEKPLSLDIIVKRISYKNYTLLLHAGRMLKNGKSTSHIDEHLKLIHKNNMNDMSALISSFYNRLVRPVNNMAKALEYMSKNYSDETDKCNSLLNEWDKTENSFKTIFKKRERDALITPSEWDLNEIIYEELNFLKISQGTGVFRVEISLDNTLPPVYGIGKNFSLAIGLLLKASVMSLKDPGNEFLVSTRAINKKNLIEIKLPDIYDFNRQLAELVYPSVEKGDKNEFSNIEIGLRIAQMYFDVLDAEYDIGDEGKTTIIRMRLPIEDAKGRTKAKPSATLYDDDDFLL